MFEGWPGEALLIKLLETINNGIGAGLRPRQILREEAARTEARRRDLLIIAQAQRDVARISSGEMMLGQEGANLKLLPAPNSDSTASVPVEPPNEEIVDLVTAHKESLGFLETKRLLNLKKISIFAEEEAEEMKSAPVSDQPVDPDWFARWRNLAQDVSRDEMQRLWSKVLAGEARQPGTYSIHTMEFLGRMSAQDADLLSRLSPLVFDNGYIFKGAHKTFETQNVGISDLVNLDDLGIINNPHALGGLQQKFSSVSVEPISGHRYFALPINGVALLLYSDVEDKEFNLPIIPVSRVGQEILGLTSGSVLIDYLSEVVAHFKKQGCIAAEIGTWVPVVGSNQGIGDIFNRRPFPNFAGV